jgi:poly-gamma-glutamate capsule biosynthesis protein CapA/YwtB (metallophosphatase superfamily)
MKFLSVIVLVFFAFQSLSQDTLPQIPVKKNPFRFIEALEQTPFAKPVKFEFISLSAVGDMMLGTNFPNESHLPPKNVKLLEPMYPYLQNHDIIFGNLEGTVLNEGGELKSCGDPTKCYAFRQPEYFVEQYKEAGFNFLSIANNHLGDFGETGRANTVNLLKKNNFVFAGLERTPWDTLTVKEKIIGFIAFAPNTQCLQIADLKDVSARIKELDKIADIIVVSFHGGAEGSSHSHITKSTEIFYGENRGNVHRFARVAIDAGADVILGHGPHVSRAIDIYKDRFITYSMGNFCTYSRFNLSGVSGIAPLYQLKLDMEGRFIEGNLVSIKQMGEGGPVIDESSRAYKEIEKLTKEDLPEAPIQFLGDGKICPKKKLH